MADWRASCAVPGASSGAAPASSAAASTPALMLRPSCLVGQGAQADGIGEREPGAAGLD